MITSEVDFGKSVPLQLVLDNPEIVELLFSEDSKISSAKALLAMAGSTSSEVAEATGSVSLPEINKWASLDYGLNPSDSLLLCFFSASNGGEIDYQVGVDAISGFKTSFPSNHRGPKSEGLQLLCDTGALEKMELVDSDKPVYQITDSGVVLAKASLSAMRQKERELDAVAEVRAEIQGLKNELAAANEKSDGLQAQYENSMKLVESLQTQVSGGVAKIATEDTVSTEEVADES